MMEQWPESVLPLPARAVSINNEGSVVRTEMESGLVRQRQRFTTQMEVYSVSWVFTPYQYVFFKTFFTNKISQGTDFFSIPLRVGGDIKEFNCRFVGGRFSSESTDPYFVVNATLETYDTNLFNEEVYNLILALDGEIDLFIEQADEFTILINETLPTVNTW